MPRHGRSILAVAFLCQAVAVGSTLGCFGLFLLPVVEHFGATRSQIGIGFSLMMVMLGANGIVIGTLLDRVSTKHVMLTGAAIMSAAVVAASQATELWQLGVACVVVGACMPSLGPLSGSTLVGKVFREQRGRALGVVNMGAPAGGFVFALLAGSLIEAIGWQPTLLVFGTTIAAATLIPVALVVPHRPGPPDASGEQETELSEGPPGGVDPLRDRRFWGGAIGFGVMAGITAGWGPHIAAYIQDIGGSPTIAATTIALGAGIGIVGTLVFGSLSDRIQPRWILLGFMGVQLTGFTIYLMEPPIPVILCTVVAMGVCMGGMLPVYSAHSAGIFGGNSLGRVLGLSNLFIMPFGFAVPPLAGALFDARGSYSGALVVFLVALALAGAAFTLLGRDREAARPA